jgi:thiol:disulfide interchange protein DsbC
MASDKIFNINLLFSGLFSMLLAGANSLAHAGAIEDMAAIKSKLESETPPVKAKSIKPSPIAGLYEIFVQGNLIYTDKNFSHVIVNGTLIETASKKNLTEENLNQLTMIKFNELPLQNAIEVKKGSGAYKYAVFSDPDCPFCKTLETGLVKTGVSDYTAYIFLYPLRDLHPDAAAKSESIWCAKDKADAWNNFMVKGVAPEKAICDNPLAKNEALAEKIGVSGTPTIYLNNGQQTQKPQELVEAINANNKIK